MLKEVFFSHVLSQIFWFFLIFSILYVIIRSPLAQLREIVEARHVHITEKSQQARAIREEAETLRTESQKEIHTLRQKVRQEMAIMKSKIRNEGRETLLEEDHKLSFLLKEMKDKITRQHHNSMNSLEEPAITLAKNLADRIKIPYDEHKIKSVITKRFESKNISSSLSYQ